MFVTLNARGWARRGAALTLAAGMLAAAGTCGFDGLAYGSEPPMKWPLEVAAPTMLGFGATYASGDGTATHRGLDLAADPEARVLSPADGTVTFAGSVPGVGGGTVTAVTIDVGSGVSVTLLPLTAVGVRRGQTVTAGQPVAGVASGGDGSSSGSHLHVGTRRQDVYLDPASLLAPFASAADPPQTSGEPQPTQETGGESVANGAVAPVAAPAAGAASVAVAHPGALGSARPVSSSAARAGVGSEQSPAPAEAGAAGAQVEAPWVAGAQAQPRASRATGPVTRSTASERAVREARAPDAAARAARLAATAARLSRSMNTVWRAALLGTLVGLAALWPMWRRRDREEQPESAIVSEGSDVAAAVGRW